MSIKRKINSLTTYISIIVLLIPFLAVVVLSQTANAANLTNTYLRPYRMTAGQGTKMRLVFKTVAASATALTVDMNGTDGTTWSGSSGNVHAGSITSDVATCATEIGGGVLGLPGTLTITGASSRTISITGITALSATTTYCIDFTTADAVTLATAGEYHPTITESSGATDSTTVAVRTIANDQIVVSATVPPTFSFVLGGNTDSFSSNLSSSAYTSTAGKTVTIVTNATNGWITWVKDLNGSSGASTKGALKSAAASNYTIPTTNGSALGSASHTALGAGTEDYGLGATITTDFAGGGTVSLDPAYDGTSSKLGVLDPTNFRPVASSNGTANTTGDVITLTERAQIAGATPAATDYTDTLTVIGAGNF